MEKKLSPKLEYELKKFLKEIALKEESKKDDVVLDYATESKLKDLISILEQGLTKSADFESNFERLSFLGHHAGYPNLKSIFDNMSSLIYDIGDNHKSLKTGGTNLKSILSKIEQDIPYVISVNIYEFFADEIGRITVNTGESADDMVGDIMELLDKNLKPYKSS
jgi:hypothetical protein